MFRRRNTVNQRAVSIWAVTQGGDSNLQDDQVRPHHYQHRQERLACTQQKVRVKLFFSNPTKV